jgi:hypothetical protein
MSGIGCVKRLAVGAQLGCAREPNQRLQLGHTRFFRTFPALDDRRPLRQFICPDEACGSRVSAKPETCFSGGFPPCGCERVVFSCSCFHCLP